MKNKMINKSFLILIFLLCISLSYAATEICDGTDNDNDGFIDENNLCDADGDGYLSGANPNIPIHKVDCDDNDPNINPDVTKERFNGLDDDCDNEIDEGLLWRQNRVTDEDSNCMIHNGILNCTITSGYIEVYQDLDHLIPGEYYFSLTNLSENLPEIRLIDSDGEDLCDYQDNSCIVQIEELGSVIVLLNFTNDSQIDNVILQLREAEDKEVFYYNPDFDILNVNITSFLTERPVSCCPSDYCWDGGKCADSAEYMENTTKPPIVLDSEGNGYRCIKKLDEEGNETDIADWTYSKKKRTPLWYHEGYCPYNDMCLVSVDTNHSSYDQQTPYNGCAKSGEFVANSEFDYIIRPSLFEDDEKQFKDYYCNEGNWTSRTKLLAMDLMEIGKNSNKNFMIFCDRPGEVGLDEFSSLNYFSYKSQILGDMGINLSSSYLFNTDPLSNMRNIFNNFCTLIIDTEDDIATGDVFDIHDTVIIGASMNYHFEDYIPGSYSLKINDLFKEFFKSDCEGNIDEDHYFSECSKNLFYNNETLSFIYSTDDDILTDNIFILTNDNSGPLRSILNFFKRIIQFFVDLVRNMIFHPLNQIVEENYLSEEDLYTRVFYSKVGDREIQAVAQRKFNQKNTDEMELNDYGYFKFINYDMCVLDKENKYKLNLPDRSEKFVLIKYSQQFTCNLTEDNGDRITNIILVGTNNIAYNNSIDELWYDLTAKTRLQETKD